MLINSVSKGSAGNCRKSAPGFPAGKQRECRSRAGRGPGPIQVSSLVYRRTDRGRGRQSFRFHHLEIRTKETEDAKPVFCNRDILSRRICIYLPELSHTRMVRFPDPDSLSFLDNLTLAPTSLVVPPPFFRDDFLKNLPRKGRQWIFVTTGESSLRAAEQLSIRCPGSAILSAENAAALLRQEYQIREPV